MHLIETFYFCFPQDGWSSIHYAIWGLARALGLCGKQEAFTAKDVAKALDIFNHLIHHGANTKVPLQLTHFSRLLLFCWVPLLFIVFGAFVLFCIVVGASNARSVIVLQTPRAESLCIVATP